jgi:hypothetical protein
MSMKCVLNLTLHLDIDRNNDKLLKTIWKHKKKLNITLGSFWLYGQTSFITPCNAPIVVHYTLDLKLLHAWLVRV